MAWKKVKLGEVIQNRLGRYKPQDLEIIRLQRISKIDFSGKIYLSEKDSNTDMILIKKGDFVISGINVEKGAMAVYVGEKDILATIHYSSYIIDHSKIDLEFLEIYLKSQNFIKAIKDQVPGGIKTEIKPKHILPLIVEIPATITEQQEFVKKFQTTQSKQAELLTQLTTQQTLIKKLKQAYLSEAIRGELVEQDLSDEPARELLARIKAEKLKNQTKKFKPLKPITAEEIPFQIPKSWTWCRLGEICEFISGNNFESGDFGKNNGIKCIKITNAGVQSIFETNDTLPLEFETKYKNYLAFTGDLILALTRPYIAEGLKISICPFSYNSSLINQRVAILRTNKLTWNKYIYTFLKSETVLNLYKSKFQKIGQQPNLKKDDVVNLLIPLPPLAEQGRIVARLDELMALCDRLESENLRSQAQTKELLAVVLKESLNATF